MSAAIPRDELVDEVRAYIVALAEHRPSDVDEAVALTALERLRMTEPDQGERLSLLLDETNFRLCTLIRSAERVVRAFTAEAEDWNDGEFALMGQGRSGQLFG